MLSLYRTHAKTFSEASVVIIDLYVGILHHAGDQTNYVINFA